MHMCTDTHTLEGSHTFITSTQLCFLVCAASMRHSALTALSQLMGQGCPT